MSRTRTEVAIVGPGFAPFLCRDIDQAQGMMRSTSIVLPPMETRFIATREVSDWVPWKPDQEASAEE